MDYRLLPDIIQWLFEVNNENLSMVDTISHLGIFIIIIFNYIEKKNFYLIVFI